MTKNRKIQKSRKGPKMRNPKKESSKKTELHSKEKSRKGPKIGNSKKKA